MWWNFIARTGEEIAAARERWQAELTGAAGATGPTGSEEFRPGPFGAVAGFEGPRAAAAVVAAAPARPYPVILASGSRLPR